MECNGRRVHASSVLVQVHDLYTYWGPVPLRLSPDVGDGLTAMAVERVSIGAAAGLAARVRNPRTRQIAGLLVIMFGLYALVDWFTQ